MQLGDLQNEVIAAQQRPLSRLAGIDGYEFTKGHKNFWKKKYICHQLYAGTPGNRTQLSIIN